MKPRVLMIGRTRYRLPLAPWLRKKFDALAAELDVRVLASSGDGSPGDETFELVRPLRPRVLDGLAFHLLLPLRSARAIRRWRPDAVVAEDPFAGLAALTARRLAGAPRPRVIVEAHGNWRVSTRLYGSPARRLVAPLADAIARYSLRRADATRALSAYTAGLVADVRGRPPEAQFATWSDLGVFAARPPSPLPVSPTALFVGALERYKNVDGLAAAWPRVVERVREARLVIVGKGPLAPLVERLCREQPGVEWRPELAPEEVAAAMDDAWVLVLPSRHEGLGRVVLEAFARGRGVVGGRAGGILDLVEEGREGLLVDPERVHELVEALARVLSDRALAERLGEAGQRRFAEWQTTPEEFAARMRALVDRALH